MSTEQKAQEPNPNVNVNTNDNLNSESEHEEKQQEQAPLQSSTRTPFTNLSQDDADLALARTLQEQERAYMMFRMNNDGSDYGSWEAGSYLQDFDDDDFRDPHDHDDTDGDDNDDDDEEEEEGEYDGTDADDDVDAFDVHAHAENVEEDNHPRVEFDPAVFSRDEAYVERFRMLKKEKWLLDCSP